MKHIKLTVLTILIGIFMAANICWAGPPEQTAIIDVDYVIESTPYITLTWNSTENTDYYEMYRSFDDSDYELLDTIPWTSTTYSYYEMVGGNPMYWRVKACNTYGCSDFSEPASETIVVPNPLVYFNNFTIGNANDYCVRLYYSNPGGAVAYRIYFSTTQGDHSVYTQDTTVTDVELCFQNDIRFYSVAAKDQWGHYSAEPLATKMVSIRHTNDDVFFAADIDRDNCMTGNDFSRFMCDYRDNDSCEDGNYTDCDAGTSFCTRSDLDEDAALISGNDYSLFITDYINCECEGGCIEK